MSRLVIARAPGFYTGTRLALIRSEFGMCLYLLAEIPIKEPNAVSAEIRDRLRK
jgi:hypothetical protein